MITSIESAAVAMIELNFNSEQIEGGKPRKFFNLLRLRLGSIERGASTKRLSALDHVTVGLEYELQGDVASAQGHYVRCARQPGAVGLVGKLLLAWLPDSSEKEFDRASRALERLDEELRSRIASTVQIRLALWAFERGWPVRAEQHYVLAMEWATQVEKKLLGESGHLYGQSRTLHLEQFDDQLTRTDLLQPVSAAAESKVEKVVSDRARGTWTRTIVFGGDTNLSRLESAQLQASWLGAAWLLPQIRRQFAAHILDSQPDADQAARALGYWALGGGSNVDRLVDSCEDLLTSSAVENLVLHQLRSGRSLQNPDTWLAICGSLWDEIPDELVSDLINTLPFDGKDGVEPYSLNAKVASVFTPLYMRSPSRWEARLGDLSSADLSLVVRSMGEFQARRMSADLAARLFRSFCGTDWSNDWSSSGWASAACLARTAEPAGLLSKMEIDEFSSRVPSSATLDVARISPNLLPQATVLQLNEDSRDRLAGELPLARQGTFHGWTTNPSLAYAHSAIVLNRITKSGVRDLDELASSPLASHEQRMGSLIALTRLADAVNIDLAGLHCLRSDTTLIRRNHIMGSTPADLRLEIASRIALQVRLSSTPNDVSSVVSGCRDADLRVRATSLETAIYANGRSSNRALDAALFGALYDPTEGAQKLGVRALLTGKIRDEELQDSGLSRLASMWENAHRNVRSEIVRGLSSARTVSSASLIPELLAAASRDRSWIVRNAANE